MCTRYSFVAYLFFYYLETGLFLRTMFRGKSSGSVSSIIFLLLSIDWFGRWGHRQDSAEVSNDSLRHAGIIIHFTGLHVTSCSHVGGQEERVFSLIETWLHFLLYWPRTSPPCHVFPNQEYANDWVMMVITMMMMMIMMIMIISYHLRNF